MKHTISVLLQNKPGVLSRVTGLFSGRGFNIESLAVNQTLDPEVSCLTLVTTGPDSIIEQITKQLHKLIDVIKVTDMREVDCVEREMALIRVKAEAATRAEVLRIVDIFRGKVVDVSQGSAKLTLLVGADKQEVELKPAGDKLEAKGSFKLGANAKAVAVVALAGKSSTARFVLK